MLPPLCSVCVSLSLSLSVSPSVCLSVRQSDSQSVCLSLFLPPPHPPTHINKQSNNNPPPPPKKKQKKKTQNTQETAGKTSPWIRLVIHGPFRMEGPWLCVRYCYAKHRRTVTAQKKLDRFCRLTGNCMQHYETGTASRVAVTLGL